MGAAVAVAVAEWAAAAGATEVPEARVVAARSGTAAARAVADAGT